MAPDAYGLSRRYILEEVEASLWRLQTEYIDLCVAHRDNTETPLEETFDHVAATHLATVSQVALAWIRAQPGIAKDCVTCIWETA